MIHALKEIALQLRMRDGWKIPLGRPKSYWIDQLPKDKGDTYFHILDLIRLGYAYLCVVMGGWFKILCGVRM